MTKNKKTNSENQGEEPVTDTKSQASNTVEPVEFVPLNIEIDEQGFPCLSPGQLYRWNVAHLELELAKTQRELAMVKRQLWLEQQAAYRKLTADIDSATTSHASKQQDYKAVGDALTAELGFKIEGCILSDKTGRITFVDTHDRPLIGHAAPPDHARLTKA